MTPTADRAPSAERRSTDAANHALHLDTTGRPDRISGGVRIIPVSTPSDEFKAYPAGRSGPHDEGGRTPDVDPLPRRQRKSARPDPPAPAPRAPGCPWLPTPPGHRHAVTSNVRSSAEWALTCRWAAGQPCPIPPAKAPSLAATTDTTERPDAAHRRVRVAPPSLSASWPSIRIWRTLRRPSPVGWRTRATGPWTLVRGERVGAPASLRRPVAVHEPLGALPPAAARVLDA